MQRYRASGCFASGGDRAKSVTNTMTMTDAGIGAFFDMDRTLLSDSSSLLWIKYMRGRGALPFKQMMQIGGLLLRYQMGSLDMVDTTRRLVAQLAGESEHDRILFTREWFDQQLRHYVTAEGRRWVEAHRRLDHRVALITASPSYTADVVAEGLAIGAEDVLATRLEVVDGCFTGQIVEPMCYGPGKLTLAKAHADKYGLDLAASYFYTDSIVDLPLLEKVGYPVAVNPDTPLRKLATARRWHIVRFY